jgi:hypothetical protein
VECVAEESAIKALSQGVIKRYYDAWSALRRSEDGQISGTTVLQNLKLVVLKTTNPQISGTKVLENLRSASRTKAPFFWCLFFFCAVFFNLDKPAERFTNQAEASSERTRARQGGQSRA